MEKIPYVHLYTDVQEAMPLLARGSNAAVFLTIGILLPEHPNGPTLTDLVKVTALSVRTIQAALTLLIGSGLVTETSDGEYTPVKHIDYRRYTNNVCSSVDQSILSINQSSIKSKSSPSTGEEFIKAYQPLAAYLLLVGGIRHDEAEAFKVLWKEYPDAALHTRALELTRRKAKRPNYKYYDAVVRSGAIDYDAAKNTQSVEVNL